ncbi:multiheme c-type cytochrome [Candidatus Eisenbacteria bacterium]|uniref:Multiheme c-type cytochrome n=1 Tax=Eiseniibacteriota bacterium TaxID=2212470 RepID=A0ABV6YL36_UNCEI
MRGDQYKYGKTARRATWLALLATTLGAGFSIVSGQMFEERLEPEEIGIKDIEELVIPTVTYVGNGACETCHPAAYRKWLETKHCRAVVSLRSGMAEKIGALTGITSCCPPKSGKCMKCHGTAHNVPAAFRADQFRMGEGVSCEKCHGPGEAHVKSAEGGDAPAEMRRPPLEDCTVCHGSKPWHDMICSNCHTERESHVASQSAAYPEASVDTEGPLEATCVRCHAVRASHATLKGAERFSLDAAWKRIEHGAP